MSEELIVIITGARDYKNRWKLHTILDSLAPFRVVEGNCPTGADAFARQWLLLQGIPTRSYTADWNRYGLGAGNIRNGVMLRAYCRRPNVLVAAFPTVNSTGTIDCVNQARALGMLVENYGDIEV